jgi:hypothetical protein
MTVAPLRSLLAIAFVLLASCSSPSPETGTVQFAVSAGQALSAGAVTRVTVTSSGADIPSITTELVMTGGVWGGVIGNIPAGSNRAFLARAFDSSNTLIFEGSTSGVTISPGQITLVAITLQEINPPPPFSNEAPIIQSVVASPTTVLTGGTVSLQATAQDPNAGDTLSFTWSAAAGSFASPTQPSTSWTAPGTSGPVTLTLTVSDGHGASSSVSITVNVVNGGGQGGAVLDVHFNSWPLVAGLTASATRLDVGQSTTVVATASDSDGDALTYQWAATCAGTWTNATSSTASFTPSAIPSGACNNCQLTVSVADGRGGQTTGTVALCVATTPTNSSQPTFIRTYQSALNVPPSQQITFEATARDAQNSAMTFVWSATVGTLGTPQSSADTSRVVWTAPACVWAGTPVSITTVVRNAAGVANGKVFGVTGLPACPGVNWAATGSMIEARQRHAAVRLSDGKVLISGGYNLSGYLGSTELYDPGSGIWASTGSMGNARIDHIFTLLPNGKVLATGGSYSSSFATAELYDPVTGTWTPTGSMVSPRTWHTATLLPNGKVLVVGGRTDPFNGNSILASAELYDPATGTWALTSPMSRVREKHTATLLPDGRVLVAGGAYGNSVASAEVYDPATGTWAPIGSMAKARWWHAAVLLSDGKVLVTGGSDEASIMQASAEVYDPVTGTWASAGSMATRRMMHTATVMPNGKVLVVGGYNTSQGSGFLASSEVYDPATGTWGFLDHMGFARHHHSATVLPNGKVLVEGGNDGSNNLATAELYTP